MAVTRRASPGLSLSKLIWLAGFLFCLAGLYVFARQFMATFDHGMWDPVPLRAVLSPAILDVAHFPPPVPPGGDGILDVLLDLPAAGALIAFGVLLTLIALAGAVARKIGEERRALREHYQRQGRR